MRNGCKFGPGPLSRLRVSAGENEYIASTIIENRAFVLLSNRFSYSMAFAIFFVSRPIANVCPTLQSPVGKGFVGDVGHMGQLKNVYVDVLMDLGVRIFLK